MIRILNEENYEWLKRYVVCPVGRESNWMDYFIKGFDTYEEADAWCKENYGYGYENPSTYDEEVVIVDTMPNSGWRNKIYQHNK